METKITANFENEILNVLYTKVSFRIIGEGSQARKHIPIYLKKPGAFILEEGLNPLTESFKLTTLLPQPISGCGKFLGIRDSKKIFNHR